MKTASPQFLSWYRRKREGPIGPLVKEFAESGMCVHHSGKRKGTPAEMLRLADWAAGVAVGKINRQARKEQIAPELCIAKAAYTFLLELPPADLGSLRLREIRGKRKAAYVAFLNVVFSLHTKPMFDINEITEIRTIHEDY